MKDIKVRFSKQIPKDIADRCISVKTEYKTGGRLITLGFSFDPTDCHGEDTAFPIRDAIRKSVAKSSEPAVYIEVESQAINSNGNRTTNTAVSRITGFVGHEVVHDAESTIYVVVDYSVAFKP